MSPQYRGNPLAAAARYMSLAFILPASTFVGYLIGYLLDRAFGTNFLFIVFLLLGIAAGFVQLYREVQRLTERDGR